MIDWTQAYTASWRMVKVNTDTWSSGLVVPNVSSVSISRDCTDECPLLESASITLESKSEDFEAGWYRLEVLVKQNASMERIPVMTMLCESSDGDRDKKYIELNADGLSVLQPANEKHLLAGTYVPKNVNGAEQAARYLRACTPAPVVVEGSFTLDDYLVLDADCSHIKAAWTILDAAEWCMQIKGDGTIVIREKPKTPELLLDNAHASILRPSTSFSKDLSDIPNVYIAVDGDYRYEARNDDPESPLSTVTRGREIDYIDRSPQRINGESLKSYAERKLEEKSTITETYSYNREYWPDVLPYSLVSGSIPSTGLVENMRVLTQSLKFGKGLEISEKAGILIKGYKR